MSRRPIILVPPEHVGASSAVSGSDGRSGFGTCDGCWHVVRRAGVLPADWVFVPAGLAGEDWAELAAALQRDYGTNVPVVLALPSSWCLAATISTANVSGHQPMLYRLEERLPLAAEAVVAGFFHHPAGKTALGVCVAVDRVRPLVEGLEAAGIVVTAVSPLALLMVSGLAEGRDLVASSANRLILIRSTASSGVDLIELRGRAIVAWSLAADDQPYAGQAGAGSSTAPEPPEPDVLRRLRWKGYGPLHALHLELVAVDGTVADRAVDLLQPASVAMHGREVLLAAACDGAERLLSGEGVDLRRDALAPADALRPHRRSLKALAAAAVLLLFSVAAAAIVRSERYRAVARAADEQMLTEIRSSFPKLSSASVQDIRTLLAQERRSWENARLAGTAGSTPNRRAEAVSGTKEATTARSALRTLGRVIQSLPDGGGIYVDRTMFDETSFELAGRARKYDDLDRLTSAIRAGGMEVSSPLARRGSDGSWTFTLRGTIGATAMGSTAP